MYRNYDADRRDAEKALKDAWLFTKANWQKVTEYDDCLVNGLCWLRNEGLLNQTILDTILTSVNPRQFSEFFYHLVVNYALSKETCLKFSSLGNNQKHLSLVDDILQVFWHGHYQKDEMEKLLFLINQLDDLSTAADVSLIVAYLPHEIYTNVIAKEDRKISLDLLARPENKAAWSGIANILREHQKTRINIDDLSNIVDAEIARVASLPLLRVPKQKPILTSFLQSLSLAEPDKIETDQELRNQQARAIREYFSLIFRKRLMEKKLQNQVYA